MTKTEHTTQRHWVESRQSFKGPPYWVVLRETDIRHRQRQVAEFDTAEEAALHAAAPDLLALCKRASAIASLAAFPSDEWLAAGHQIAELYPPLRAAIAKAEEVS